MSQSLRDNFSNTNADTRNNNNRILPRISAMIDFFIGTVYSPFFLNTKYAHMPMRAMTARKPSYNVKFLKMNRAVKHKTAIAAAPLKQNVDFFI
jgi:hypothetical protein